MPWPSIIGSMFYYVILCLGSVFYFLWASLNAVLGLLLVILAPATHLATYIARGFLIPLYILEKFETLYIYLGVAALIGLLTGSVLHFSSNMLTQAFNLQVPPEQLGCTAASIREAREKKRLKGSWQVSMPVQSNQARAWVDETSQDYSEYIEKDRGKRKEGQGLLSQTILEEDDVSEDGF